jgi:hypothetical protein
MYAAVLCRAKPVPPACSDASKAIANTPEFCGGDMYAGLNGFDANGCPNTPNTLPTSSGSGTVSGPSQGDQSNVFKLSFVTRHLCSSAKVTRDCLLSNFSRFRSGQYL